MKSHKIAIAIVIVLIAAAAVSIWLVYRSININAPAPSPLPSESLQNTPNLDLAVNTVCSLQAEGAQNYINGFPAYNEGVTYGQLINTDRFPDLKWTVEPAVGSYYPVSCSFSVSSDSSAILTESMTYRFLCATDYSVAYQVGIEAGAQTIVLVNSFTPETVPKSDIAECAAQIEAFLAYFSSDLLQPPGLETAERILSEYSAYYSFDYTFEYVDNIEMLNSQFWHYSCFDSNGEILGHFYIQTLPPHDIYYGWPHAGADKVWENGAPIGTFHDN